MHSHLPALVPIALALATAAAGAPSHAQDLPPIAITGTPAAPPASAVAAPAARSNEGRHAGFRAGLGVGATLGVDLAARAGYQFDSRFGLFVEPAVEFSAVPVFLPYYHAAVALQINLTPHWFVAFGPALGAFGLRNFSPRPCPPPPNDIDCGDQWTFGPGALLRGGAEIPLRDAAGHSLGALSIMATLRALFETRSAPYVLPFGALSLGYETY